AGHRRGGDAVHRHPPPARGAQVIIGAGPGGGDDAEIIAGGGEVVGDAEHGARHAGHVRKERFGHEENPHAPDDAPRDGPQEHFATTGAGKRRCEASCSPCTSASSFAQATCGWTRPPRPQSVEPITRSGPTSCAKRSRRWATSSGCSTTLVAWETMPGTRTLSSGRARSCHTVHSCSWRTFAASKE